MSYLKFHGKRRTPQLAPIPGAGKTPNSAGGYAWAVDDWTRLRRFLILGSEGGSYYTDEWELTRENAKTLERCIEADGSRTVAEIVRVSSEGRAPKNDAAIFAVAMCVGAADESTRRAALEALPEVCRTGTHLFRFAQFVEQFRGWGRSLRRAVGRWYVDQDADALAYQAVKYRQRDGVSHRDLLRLAHPQIGWAPATRRSRSLTSMPGCSRGSWVARPPAICPGWCRASSRPSRPPRRPRAPRPCASATCRARR